MPQRKKVSWEVTPKIGEVGEPWRPRAGAAAQQQQQQDAPAAGQRRRKESDEVTPKIGTQQQQLQQMQQVQQMRMQQMQQVQDPALAGLYYWRQPPGFQAMQAPEPEPLSAEEVKEREAMIDALKRELDSTDIHMSVLSERKTRLANRLDTLESGGPVPMVFM